MPTQQYSVPELLALSQSPLVKKPSSLPSIDQWIEPQAQNARAARPKHDENETPLKRPSLFETRSRTSQMGSREDVFLGPKSSFAASASAARQATRTDDRALDDDSKAKLGARDRFRDRLDDPRQENTRSPFRARRDSNEKERPPNLRAKSGFGDGDEGEGATWRRNGVGRGGKFDQPWFRDGREKPAEEPRHDKRTSWRDRKPATHEADAFGGVRSGDEFDEPGPTAPTQHDLAAFLKSMKQKDSGAPEKSPEPAPEPAPVAPLKPVKQAPAEAPQNESFFGLFGDVNLAEKKPAETAKKPDKPKKSRFFGGGDAQPSKAPEQPPEMPMPSAPPPVPAHAPEQPMNSPPPALRASAPVSADQEGFQRMMAMLRLGGTNSQSQSSPAFPPPPLQSPQHQPSQSATGMPPPKHQQNNGQQQPRPPMENREAQHQARSSVPSLLGHKPEGASRDSEFLLNLMKSRPPLAENQIYGQNYHRPMNSEGVALGKKPFGPPPGFLPSVDRGHDNRQHGPPTQHHKPDEMQAAPGRGQDHRPQPDEQRFPPPPMGPPGPHHFDMGPPQGFFPGGPHQREGMPPPPPGFGRGNPPPGFFGPPPPPNGPPMPQHMRGMPPPQYNGPPGMFGPPPGLPPGHQQQQQQPGGGPPRRPPSGQLPPGFDMFPDGVRRGQQGQMPPGFGLPPPQQQQQFAKQGGYPGM